MAELGVSVVREASLEVNRDLAVWFLYSTVVALRVSIACPRVVAIDVETTSMYVAASAAAILRFPVGKRAPAILRELKDEYP